MARDFWSTLYSLNSVDVSGGLVFIRAALFTL
jgi:hypothetical protein